ncbi:hypothetical protein ILUMI_08059 [Ignelater luminosus]|uniref:Uncharacterized protein n=1 Tax=Ignelater luminosus TaxID=2038154 RepID=A0A8K0D892_IGNLU|nr:hypothetical protein ILUMI_08059 [Ignelater luminosus]
MIMNNFKFLFVLSCICLQVFLSKAYDENDLDETDKKCLQELNLDKSVVINNYDKDDFIKEGNIQFNQFYACAWKKDKLLQDDGSIRLLNLTNMVIAKLEKLFPGVTNSAYRGYLAGESTAPCKTVRGSDDGDTCVKIYNCILRKIGEVSQKVTPEQFRPS